MDTPSDLREFLTTRRARLTPLQAGLPDFGGRRRVPGLRREEVALLAGMSVEYYVRFERGNAKGVSEAVLEGVSRALQLDDAERSHLYDLVRSANEGLHPQRRRGPVKAQQVHPALLQLLDAMHDVPALVQNGRLDVLATNGLGAAVFSELYVQPQRPVNFARSVFLDEGAQAFYRDWDEVAQQTVALLRAEAGRSPSDRILSDLVGELSTRSESFRRLWGSHDVRIHRTGLKRLAHRELGDLDMNFEVMELSSHPGMSLVAYSAEPGSATVDALRLLASWAASTSQRSPVEPGAAPD